MNTTTISPKSSLAKLVLCPKRDLLKLWFWDNQESGNPESIPETPVVANKLFKFYTYRTTISSSCTTRISNQCIVCFETLRRFWRVGSEWSRDLHAALSRPLARAATDTCDNDIHNTRKIELDEEDEARLVRCDSTSSSSQSVTEEFWARASTDSRLPPRPERQRHQPSARPLSPPVRTMSVAMRGNNTSTY